MFCFHNFNRVNGLDRHFEIYRRKSLLSSTIRPFGPKMDTNVLILEKPLPGFSVLADTEELLRLRERHLIGRRGVRNVAEWTRNICGRLQNTVVPCQSRRII